MNILDAAREKYAKGYYQAQLEAGLHFQDVVTRALYHHGIVIVGYCSKYFQQNEGENILGIEIKRDDRFRETGNLYIEVAEKSHPDNLRYVNSGIMRNDNQWLFVIGDEEEVWIFSTKYLRKLKDRFRRWEGPTSIGHLMPLEDADRYCIRKIHLG